MISCNCCPSSDDCKQMNQCLNTLVTARQPKVPVIKQWGAISTVQQPTTAVAVSEVGTFTEEQWRNLKPINQEYGKFGAVATSLEMSFNDAFAKVKAKRPHWHSFDVCFRGLYVCACGAGKGEIK